MNWDLTGKTIWARYLDEYDVYGVVESSRVKYGGEVQHTVVLPEPMKIYGREADRLLIDNKTITRVKD